MIAFLDPGEYSCPDGYVMFMESCYNYVQEDLTFGEAEAKCYEDGGWLAAPETNIQVTTSISCFAS